MIIALISLKGGAGKSTLSINLAAEGVRRGKRVLIIDCDSQFTAKKWHDVACELEAPTPSLVVQPPAPEGKRQTLHKPEQVPTLSKPYDLTIIDCPAKIATMQTSAMFVSDIAVLPCEPSAPEVWALGDTFEAIHQALLVKPDLKVRLLINKLDKRTKSGKQAKAVFEGIEFPLCETELSIRDDYRQSLLAGRGVTTFAPKGDAAWEIRRLYNEIMAIATGEASDVEGEERAAEGNGATSEIGS